MTTSIEIPESVRALPIAAVVADVFTALLSTNVALNAEPGAGKSTGLPLALIQAASPNNKIIMLEPRRLAALGVAERLATQIGEPLGQRIGLRMRGQTAVSNNTCLEVVTEGVLTRLLQADPTLDGVGLVIFDEFHERSLHADLGLTLCLEVQQALRDDLRILLMSATLDLPEIKAGDKSLHRIDCPGRQFPVKIHWLGNSNDELSVRILRSVTMALQQEKGDVLVFLPGVAEINRAAKLIEPALAQNVELFRLHGRAEAKVQRAATAKASLTRRRVILSTSIAETSITIDGVRVVIDAGLERRTTADSSAGVQRLETVMASQASATQRAGRAGRTESGVCYRLWSEHDHKRRALSWQAEILRSELSSLLLELAQWGATDIQSLPWLDAPPAAAIDRAAALLSALGLWKNGRLTDHGSAVAELPVHPRLGHMLLWAAERGAANLACNLAIILEDGGGKLYSVDVDLQLQQTQTSYQKRRVSQLRSKLDSKQHSNPPTIAVLIAQAYPDWIGQRRRGADSRYALSCGAGAFMSADDSLARSSWLSIANLGGATKEARIFLASELDIDDLEERSPDMFSTTNQIEWDDKLERVVAEQRKQLGSLIVQTRQLDDLSEHDTAQAMLDGIRKRGITCLPWNDTCREWQARMQLMSSLISIDNEPAWPKVDDANLMESLENWLLPWLAGKNSLKALAQLDLIGVFRAMLNYQQTSELNAMLPERFTVPSGSNIRLRYSGGSDPVLSVKLQEMLGCAENPTIANGRIVLKIELLSPARRPVQLTSDLAGFWNNSYPAIKKEMAGRYPKHDWPDKPLSAKPTAYAKRRKKQSDR